MTLFDDGRLLFTARHPDEITNVATGKSIVLELQGSGASVPKLDGSVELRLSGKTSFTFFPGDLGPRHRDRPDLLVHRHHRAGIRTRRFRRRVPVDRDDRGRLRHDRVICAT